MRADGVGHVGFVGRVDVEGVGDARGGDFYAFGVFGRQGTVFEGGGEEVDDGESETLFGVESSRLIELAWVSKYLTVKRRKRLP